MSDELVVAKIRKTAANEVWIVLKRYEGKPICDLREYFQGADTPAWLPTRKGVGIPLESLPAAIDAAEALAHCDAVGQAGSIARGKNAEIRFSVSEYQRHIYADVRLYYQERGNEDWKPGKGVTFPLSHVGKVLDALHLAEDSAAAFAKT